MVEPLFLSLVFPKVLLCLDKQHLQSIFKLVGAFVDVPVKVLYAKNGKMWKFVTITFDTVQFFTRIL